MGREAPLWKWLSARLPLGHFSRIESETSPGFPDIYYQVPAVPAMHIGAARPAGCGLIEMKADKTGREKYPFRGADDGLRVTQIRWFEDYYENEGKNLWICARVGNSVLWIPGTRFTEFNAMSREELHQASILTFEKFCDPESTSIQIRRILT